MARARRSTSVANAAPLREMAGQCPSLQRLEHARGNKGRAAAANRFDSLAAPSSVEFLSNVAVESAPRFPTGLEEFDRVLGGGMVPGSVVLIGGDPGIGKSTLLLQALAQPGAGAPGPLRLRRGIAQPGRAARRAGSASTARGCRCWPRFRSSGSTPPSSSTGRRWWSSTRSRPCSPSELQSAPGSVAQVRDCAAQLTRMAKQQGITVVMIGHVTKEGALAGPRVLEHMVDTVLYFEGDNSFDLPARPRHQEPLRRGQRTRRVRDDRSRPARRQQPVGAVPVAACAAGARAPACW